MDLECFVSMLDLSRTDLIKIIRGYLLEGFQSKTGIKAELNKLNIHSTYLIFVHRYMVLCCCLAEGSFIKPHVGTSRSKKMFGSLVIVFPTPHEGGALSLRHHGHEWTFDSGQALRLAAVGQPTIDYVAFFSDIEQEVAPVTSGHRVTLTYNLYFDDSGFVSENDVVSGHPVPPQPPNQEGFRGAFKALLEDPEFMADGGTLAFGLRHVYPITVKKNLKHAYNILKGSDAVVYKSMHALGFEPVLYIYYEDEDRDEDKYQDEQCDVFQGTMVDKLIDFGNVYEDNLLNIVRGWEGDGIPVRQDGGEMCDDEDFDDREPVEWVTPLTTYNRQKSAFATLGKSGLEATLNWAYGDVCLIARIGKAGDRLAYPTAAQVKNAFKQKWSERSRHRTQEFRPLGNEDVLSYMRDSFSRHFGP